MNAVPQAQDREQAEDDSRADDTTGAFSHLSFRQRIRLPLMILGPAAALVVAAYFYFTSGRYESTDDAYVRAAQVEISSNVAGRVAMLAVHDNQRVHRGDVLFKLDDAPFSIAVAAAEAQVSKARMEVKALKATYRQREAELAAARETLDYRNNELRRQQRLLSKGLASQAQFDAAEHARQSAQQRYSSAQQQIGVALAALNGDADVALDRHPSVMAAQAQLDRARLNFSYTIVTAPSDGVVTKVEQLQVGDYIEASEPVFALVSTRDVWIEANFKEVQLAHMRPDQSATVVIDALPDRKFTARVASLSPGTGSAFSALPAENATGNWVKVVQRVPVQLTIENLPPSTLLQSGLSATVEVDTQFHRHLFGRSDTGALATTRN